MLPHLAFERRPPFAANRRQAAAVVLAAVAAMVVSTVVARPAHAAATLYVGAGGGPGECAAPFYPTVASAVGAAASGDTVHVCAGTYPVSQTIITNGDLTLEGDGADVTFIDGGAQTSLLDGRTNTITVRGLSLDNGYDPATTAVGGAIHADNVVVDQSQFAGNAVGGAGGAIEATDSLIVTRSTFYANGGSTTQAGGALYTHFGQITVSNSTFYGNNAIGGPFGTGNGGAIYAAFGGLDVRNSTFVANTSTGFAALGEANGEFTLGNDVIAQDGATDNCGFTAPADLMTDLGGNLSTDQTCSPTNEWQPVTEGDLNLGALQGNGGPEFTIALGDSSVAIDAGIDAICAAGPVDGIDERGLSRPVGDHCDSGAFEAGHPGPDTTPPVVTPPADITAYATDPSQAAVVTYDGASAVDDRDGALVPDCVPASGSLIGVGVRTGTCTATDAAGNVGSADFTITVLRATDPITVQLLVDPGGSGFAGGTFGVQVDCDGDGGSYSSTIDTRVNDSLTIDAVPEGTNCYVTQTSAPDPPAGYQWDAPLIFFQPITVSPTAAAAVIRDVLVPVSTTPISVAPDRLARERRQPLSSAGVRSPWARGCRSPAVA